MKETLINKEVSVKEFITMQKIKEYNLYNSPEIADYRFAVIWQLFDSLWEPKSLLNWFFNTEKTVTGNEFIEIRKEETCIRIYDRSQWLLGEEYYLPFPEDGDYFEMSFKNFEEILLRWEELRISKPDIILMVIHEDNYVTLETDPKIIKEYQDAGYAFDIHKNSYDIH